MKLLPRDSTRRFSRRRAPAPLGCGRAAASARMLEGVSQTWEGCPEARPRYSHAGRGTRASGSRSRMAHAVHESPDCASNEFTTRPATAAASPSTSLRHAAPPGRRPPPRSTRAAQRMPAHLLGVLRLLASRPKLALRTLQRAAARLLAVLAARPLLARTLHPRAELAPLALAGRKKIAAVAAREPGQGRAARGACGARARGAAQAGRRRGGGGDARHEAEEAPGAREGRVDGRRVAAGQVGDGRVGRGADGAGACWVARVG